MGRLTIDITNPQQNLKKARIYAGSGAIFAIWCRTVLDVRIFPLYSSREIQHIDSY